MHKIWKENTKSGRDRFISVVSGKTFNTDIFWYILQNF